MTVSQKQIEANRRNAQKSTGPRTGEGKAVSSRNALKHGVLSEVVVAQSEEKELFEGLLAGLRQEFEPETQMQESLVERLALLLWRERRLSAMEQLAIDTRLDLAEQADGFAFGVPSLYQEGDLRAEKGFLDLDEQLKIGRYQIMLSNQIESTLKLLRNEKNSAVKVIEADVCLTSGFEPSNDA